MLLHDLPPGLRRAYERLMGHGRAVPRAGDTVLSLDTVSDLSCRQAPAAVRAWVERSSGDHRIFVPLCAIEERLAGVALHRNRNAAEAEMIARLVQTYLATLDPTRIIEDTGSEFQLSLVVARGIPQVNGLDLSGNVEGLKTGSRVKIAVHAHVHGLHVVSSSVPYYRKLRCHINFGLIIKPSTGVAY